MTLPILKTVLLTLFLSGLTSCKSQSNANEVKNEKPALGFSKLTTELPDKVWSLFQDSKNQYWFGSNGNGVFIYDGYSLRQFTTNDGLTSNSIRSIQEDKLGNVFIETPKGVSRYNGATFTTLEINSATPDDWKLEPSDLWFNCNTNAQDIYRYDGTSLIQLKLPRQDLDKAFETKVSGLSFPSMSHSPYSVFGINKDKSGNLWIGTSVAGAFRFDGKSFLWFPEKELTTLPDGRVPGVRSILEDKNECFWLSNFISKYKVNENTNSPIYTKLKGMDLAEHFKNDLPYFNAGLSDKNGDLWMTTYSRDVWKYDGTQLAKYAAMNGDTEALVVSIYEDKKGVLWLGTDNVGVLKFNVDTFEKFNP